MSILTKEEQAALIRAMYERRMEEPRTKVYQMAESLKVSRNTVSRHWRKALEKGILFKPQLRLKMFAEVKEYVHALFRYSFS